MVELKPSPSYPVAFNGILLSFQTSLLYTQQWQHLKVLYMQHKIQVRLLSSVFIYACFHLVNRLSPSYPLQFPISLVCFAQSPLHFFLSSHLLPSNTLPPFSPCHSSNPYIHWSSSLSSSFMIFPWQTKLIHLLTLPNHLRALLCSALEW